jgi:hypothetical protein
MANKKDEKPKPVKKVDRKKVIRREKRRGLEVQGMIVI